MNVRKLLPVLVLACKLLSAQSAQLPEPILKSVGQPRYPALARAARIEGEVRLEFVLNHDGDPSAVAVISGHPMLAPSAVETVQTWKFEFPENAFQEGRKYETTFAYKLSKETEDVAPLGLLYPNVLLPFLFRAAQRAFIASDKRFRPAAAGGPGKPRVAHTCVHVWE